MAQLIRGQHGERPAEPGEHLGHSVQPLGPAAHQQPMIQSHPPLISTDLYERAQQTIKARGTNGDAGKAPRHTGRPYLFRGLITCGLCDRKMVGNPNHGRLYR